MLCALLVDAFVDRLFAATAAGADDRLLFRDAVAARSPSVARLMSLAALEPDGPRLQLVAVEMPPAEYPALPIEDFMVSLYSAMTVQRVRLVAGGQLYDVHQLIDDAVEELALVTAGDAPMAAISGGRASIGNI